jgi:cell wall assembly regulator SMI1
MMEEEVLRALSSVLVGPAADVPILRPAADVDDIVAAEEHLAFKFPLDYRLFLQMTNGAEFVGAVFWSTAELAVYNIEYQFPQLAPWFIAIGSDGGGEAIGYMRAEPDQGVFAIPFIGMDQPLAVASSLVELLSTMAAGHSLLGRSSTQ